MLDGSFKGGSSALAQRGRGEAQAKRGKGPLAFGALGPAVYFATNEDVAKLYTKYTKNKSVFLYTCTINTQNMVDEARGTGPKRILEALAKERKTIEDQIKFKGAGTIISMFDVYGMRETFKRLRSMGCTGQYVTFSTYGGFTGIAVYDPAKVIKIESQQEIVEEWLGGSDREAPVESINKLIHLSISAYSIFDSNQRAAIIRHFDAALNAIGG